MFLIVVLLLLSFHSSSLHINYIEPNLLLEITLSIKLHILVLLLLNKIYLFELELVILARILFKDSRCPVFSSSSLWSYILELELLPNIVLNITIGSEQFLLFFVSSLILDLILWIIGVMNELFFFQFIVF